MGEGSGARAVAEVAGRGQAGVPAVAAVVAATVGRGLRPAGRRGLRPAVQHLLRRHDQAELAVAAKVLEKGYTGSHKTYGRVISRTQNAQYVMVPFPATYPQGIVRPSTKLDFILRKAHLRRTQTEPGRTV